MFSKSCLPLIDVLILVSMGLVKSRLLTKGNDRLTSPVSVRGRSGSFLDLGSNSSSSSSEEIEWRIPYSSLIFTFGFRADYEDWCLKPPIFGWDESLERPDIILSRSLSD